MSRAKTGNNAIAPLNKTTNKSKAIALSTIWFENTKRKPSRTLCATEDFSSCGGIGVRGTNAIAAKAPIIKNASMPNVYFAPAPLVEASANP